MIVYIIVAHENKFDFFSSHFALLKWKIYELETLVGANTNAFQLKILFLDDFFIFFISSDAELHLNFVLSAIPCIASQAVEEN